jgi:D-lactate dehydrogenase
MANITFYKLLPFFEQGLKDILKGHTLVFVDELLSESTISKAKDAEIIGLMLSEVTEERLAKMPKLRCIVTFSTGFNHIDLKACANRNIVVCNVPAYGDRTVAEHAIGLMLMVSRRIFDSIKQTRSGSFEWAPELIGADLNGKTLGVVGTGKIGRNVAHIAGEGLGMKVVAYDVIKNEDWAKECGIQYVPFDKLLAESDIMSFHVPLTKETTHMINTKNLNKIKKGAILINTARGAIVETAAIIEGLNKGIFSGAGLDVLEEECELREGRIPKACSLLLSHPRAYITPHSAFYSKEALQRILDTSVENINAFLKGKPANTVK